MRYKDAFGKYFLNGKDMTIYFVACKAGRQRARAYHAQLINLSSGDDHEVVGIDKIPDYWTPVDIQVVEKQNG